MDFKSLPYRDTELLEWNERIRLAQGVQDRLGEGKVDEAAAELRRQRVTHLIWPGTRPLESSGLEAVRQVGAYWVYRVEERAKTR